MTPTRPHSFPVADGYHAVPQVGPGSHSWNRGVGRVAFLPEVLGENPFPGLFQLLEATCIPWLTAQPPSSEPASASVLTSPLTPVHLAGPCGCTGPTDGPGPSPHHACRAPLATQGNVSAGPTDSSSARHVTPSATHLFTYLFSSLAINPPTGYSSICLSSIQPSFCVPGRQSFIRSLVHPPTHPSTHPPTTHPSTHMLICPSVRPNGSGCKGGRLGDLRVGGDTGGWSPKYPQTLLGSVSLLLPAPS